MDIPLLVSTYDIRYNECNRIINEMGKALQPSNLCTPIVFSFKDPECQLDYDDSMYRKSPVHSLKLTDEINDKFLLEAICEFKIEINKRLICGSKEEILKWLNSDLSIKDLCDWYTLQKEEFFTDIFRAIPSLNKKV